MIKVSRVSAFKDNYIWLLHTPGDDARVVAVDPGDAAPVTRHLDDHDLSLVGILATHHHADHVGGIATLVAEWQCPVWGPARENIPCRTHALHEGDDIEVFGMHFTVLDVPGHTAGHIAYYGEGMLLIGDTLFAAGCGRLFEGTAEQMQHSLAKLLQLPPETLMFCAHEYTVANLAFARAVEPDNSALVARELQARAQREAGEATIPSRLGDEFATNPFLRWDAPSVIAAASREAGQALTTPVAVFATVRRWKDRF